MKGVELLVKILGGKESIGTLVDLDDLPPKLHEIERKYRLKENGLGDGGMLEFSARLFPFFGERKVRLDTSAPFTGIDEYYVVESRENELRTTFRYRVGANKLPELTAKFKRAGESNEVRGEVNLDVSNNKPHEVRTMLTLICGFAETVRTFSVRQDGTVWAVFDPELGKLEIVGYRVGGMNPHKPSITLAEIEPRGFSDPEEALHMIDVYEKGLGFSKQRCNESIAELFGAD